MEDLDAKKSKSIQGRELGWWVVNYCYRWAVVPSTDVVDFQDGYMQNRYVGFGSP